jgi:predicted nuclease of predicted toxin-antitoxin system
MTIVFDEHFSHHLTEFLHKAGAPGDIQHVRKLKWNGMPDEEWMRLAIGAGFTILSADRNEATRGLRVGDFKTLGARVVLLSSFWDHLGVWEKSKWLVKHWDALSDLCASLEAGSCVLVDKRGKGMLQ